MDSAASQRVPDFYIVGHHKCGTTALYTMLGRHPQIYLPRTKEPRFFATDLRFPGEPHQKVLPETLEEYVALFADARPEQLVGEGSPMYLWSREAARNIAAVQPGARIIAILREPASFLYSLHNHWLIHHIEPEKDLRRALELEQTRREAGLDLSSSYWPQALLYSDHVRYVEQLRRYREYFGAEQMLVLIYEDFRRDNEGTLKQVLRFLEVDDTVVIEPLERMVSTRTLRFRRVDDMIRGLYGGRTPWARTAKATINALTSDRLRRAALRLIRRRVVYSAPQPPDEALVLELRRRFKPEVDALSSFLERDLVAAWGYDRLD